MHYNLQIVALLELHFSFAVLEEEHQNNARFNWSITTSDYELNSLKSSTLIRQKVQNDTWLNPSLDIDCMDLGLLFVFSRFCESYGAYQSWNRKICARDVV